MTAPIVRAAAKREMAAAARWYERERAGLGDRFLDAIGVVLDAIAVRPSAFAVVHRDLRRALVPRFPYVVLYRLASDRVIVVACMHAKQSPRRWTAREPVSPYAT